MLVKQLLELFDILDSAYASGEQLLAYLKQLGAKEEWLSTKTCPGVEAGSTDFVKVRIPGSRGKMSGGPAPTLGIIGRLGGLGARPERIGFVSDGDGALTALAVAAKLIAMQGKGDSLPGDMIIATHICPNAIMVPHEPVAFMDAPVDMATMNQMEVDPDMDAILSVDTTKGNRLINHLGIAISPTVKEGYILRVSEDLLDLLEITSGDLPQVFALSDQDITPYGNGIFHLNSIMQPATATSAAVVGVAITTKAAVPGSASGAATLSSLDVAGRFCLEVAKSYTRQQCQFYSASEFELLTQKYGSRKIMQTQGEKRC